MARIPSFEFEPFGAPAGTAPSLALAAALALSWGWAAPVTAQQVFDFPWDETAALYADDPPPESRQYDFQIGEWEIDARRYAPAGAQISRVRVEMTFEYLNDGRMMVGDWTAFSPTTGEKVSHGVTLRTYSARTGKWQNVYLRSMASAVATGWETERVGDEIHGGGETFRVRFYDITEDGYEWEQRVSPDGGQTWYLERTQSARRIR